MPFTSSHNQLKIHFQLAVVLALITFGVSAQTNPNPPIESEEKMVKQFISSVARIELVEIESEWIIDSVGFDSTIPERIRIEISDLTAIKLDRNNDSQGYSLSESRFAKRVELPNGDLDGLLYSLFFEEKVSNESKCYQPHHGILFYYANNERLGFVEICFRCSTLSTTPDVPYLRNLHERSYKKLERIFQKNGFDLSKYELN